LSENNRLSVKYMRLKDTGPQEVMNTYHDNCIGCHRRTAGAGEKSGPQACGDCHREAVPIASSRQPMGLDRSLHYRHSKALDNKCAECHHKYDPVAQKLYYAKGEEGTCRYCHEEKTEDNRISMRLASHIDCVNCHRQTLAQNKSAGPITCGGCHDAEQQKMIQKVKNVPRMEAGQPDFVFVNSVKTEPAAPNPAGRMQLVPFNHKAHETYNDTCRVCHHANLKACNDCHTLDGAKEGDFVKLEQAMHQRSSKQSCIGCHEAQLIEPACAGCHSSFEQKRTQDTSACLNCHMTPPSQAPAVENMPADTQAEIQKAAARLALESRETVTQTFAAEDIPETVVIKELMDQYEPVKMPHRKIILSMVDHIRGNKLANYFHHEKGTVCQGCHHNSPASLKPPRCVSCHGKPFNTRDPFKPGLMAAYHRQCMECHDAMGIQKPAATDCTACHPKKF
jgi:hypothetical protein